MCKKLIYLISVVLVTGFIGLCPGQAQEVENLLENGGFEDGVATPWSEYGGATLEVVSSLVDAAVPEEPIEGDFCLHIVVPNAGANTWDFGLQHSGHTFEAGKTYTLSAFLKCKEGTLDIHFKPELGEDPWTGYGNQDVTMTDEWVEYSVTTPVFTDDVTPGTITFHIGFDAGDFWVDGVRWYEGSYVPPDLGAKYQASEPVPDDGTLLTDFPGGLLGTGLRWAAGDAAVTHDVYFGETYADVEAGTGGTFCGNQATTFFYVGYGYMPNDPAPDGLVPGTTYYWRIDEINDADPNSPWEGNVWSFSVPDTKAYSPNPPDGAQFMDPNVDLNWEPALGGIMYTVYFGDDYDTVNDATTDGTLVGGATTYDPGPLELEKTYYWRVETSGAYGDFTGEVLSFKTTIPGLGTIISERWDNITGIDLDTLKSNIKYPNNPDVTEVLTEFSTNPGLDNYGGRIYGWVYAPATGDYTFWLCADNSGELWLSTNDDASNAELVAQESNWRDINTWGTGEERSDPIPLVGGEKYYIMALWKEEDGGDHCQVAWQGPGVPTLTIIPGSNLSPYEPLGAYGANPINGATGVTQVPVLEWKPGIQAASHQVYFGTDEDVVKNATTASPEYIGTRALGNESYDPGKLDWASTYYWRVDEVNNINPDSPWPGAVWSFTTADYAIVDDFEGYDDENQIWYNWIDGLGYVKPDNTSHPGNGSGAEIGDPATTSFTEETIVHGGSQSMPLKFDNNNPFKLKYSEAKLTLTKQRDWTDGGIRALSLWFYGIPGSVGSFTDNFDGTYTMTASGYDIWTNADGVEADEFHFAYKMLTGAGTIITRVDSVSNTNEWAKAGVMIRETLDPNSPHAFACITPAQGVASQGRPSTGGTSINVNQTGITAPHWVKLERDISGNFTITHSTNGTSWEQVTGDIVQNIPMTANVYVGLAVTAHDAALTCQAEFSNVTITGTVSGQWTSLDIGIESNDPEQMYVAIANNTGQPAVVYHDDQNAAQIDTWTEWNIDLADFTGINLADVNSIAIGFGNRNQPQAGGSGKMYFDDIRLYRPRYIPGMGTLLAADFNGDGVVDYRDLEVMAGDWLATDSFTAATVPSGSPVGWWKFDDNTNDSVGTNHGTANGSPGYVAGMDGQAISLDGVNDYVSVGSVGISGAAPRTIAGWAKADVTEMSDWINVFGFTGPSEDGRHFDIEHVGDTDDSTHGYYGVHIYGDEYDIIPVDLDWHHLAATYDGTTGYYYGDGVLIGSATIAIDTPDNVHIGKREDNDNYFQGSVDDVRIYDHVLSDAEIAGLVDDTPGDGQLYVQVPSPANIYDDEPEGSRSVNFKDFAVLADMWLDEQVWPEW